MDDPPIGPGRRLGRFLLLERIGAGGMGVVYRARDERLKRDVALKLLLPAASLDPSARARLIREARLASSLNHPGITTIYEVDEEGDWTFIVMELMDGRRLCDTIHKGGLPPPTVLRLGAQIAEALAYAHHHGVLHRDLKTANVIVTPDGRAKILDFGLAKHFASDTSETVEATALTQTGTIAGTTPYLAPEILRGETADARSDLWALGVVLFEMASGRLPFGGRTSYEVSANILNADPPELPAPVPNGLRAVVRRCLEKEPGHRYQEAIEVRAALEALMVSPGEAENTRSAPARRRSKAILGIGAALAVVAVAAVLLLAPYRGCPGMGGPIQSLAVLPLANLSGDPRQDYFADGMTDELISAFTRIGALRVISRTSVMEYKLHPKPARTVARELGVQAVLEGTVRQFAGRVRITLDLVRAATERNLWSESYERNNQDVLALQSEVAQKVAEEIQVRLTARDRERLQQSRRVEPRAHELFLKARHRLYEAELSRAAVTEALDEFEQAIRIDPGYAVAHAGKAEAYYLISNYFMPPDSALPLAKREAAEALRLDENLADAHAILGMTYAGYDWDWKKAEPELRRAIELSPGADGPHMFYGYWLQSQGRFAEAQRELDLSVELNPLSKFASWLTAWPSFYQRRYDEANRRLREQIAADSTNWMPYSLLGESLEQQGHLEEAASVLAHARTLGGNPWVTAALARVDAKLGLRDSTAGLLRALVDLSRTQYVTPYGRATVYMALGDLDRAFSMMDLAVRQHNEDLTLLEIDPRVDPMRNDPRFDALMKRVGFWR